MARVVGRCGGGGGAFSNFFSSGNTTECGGGVCVCVEEGVFLIFSASALYRDRYTYLLVDPLVEGGDDIVLADAEGLHALPIFGWHLLP